MAGQLEKKVGIVTGGAGGMGRAAARAFAREGARVAVADINLHGGDETVRMIREAGGQAIFVQTDVSDAAQVQALVRRTVHEFGRLDCAFNNAGINEEDSGVVELDEALWERIIDTNLKSIFLCMKYEIPAMLAGGGGAIVNTSSVVGLTATDGVPAYVASKHGIIGLTRASALDYAKRGIRVNAVCPGTIRTPMYDRRVGDDPANLARHAERTPIGRIGMPEDVAEAVVWLCSDAASFVTGHALAVDGGDSIG